MRIFIVLVFSFISCNPPTLNKESQKIVKQELDDLKVKRVTDDMLIDEAQTVGRKIAKTSQEALSKELMQAFQEKGLEKAIRYCNLQAIPIVDSLSEKYDAQIRRVSMKTRNPENIPDDQEKKILNEILQTAEVGSNIQEEKVIIFEKEILYTKPILITNSFCLNCHGTPGKEIQETNYKTLKELYPDDQATGYSVGDLRGMWSIRISKSALIKAM